MNKVKDAEIIKSKIPSYVRIYNELYDEVTSGKYEPNEQLPPEVKLAEKYEVSRNTLRQALAVLCEEGLIYNVQGKGNFISPSYKPVNQEMGKLDNIALSAAKTECQKVETQYSFSPPAKTVQEKLGLSAYDITLSTNSIYQIEETPIALSYVEIASKVLSELKIDLHDEKAIMELVTNKLFELSTYAESQLTITNAEESVADFLKTSINTPLIYIEEILYGFREEPLALCKHYLHPRYYSISFMRKKNGSRVGN